MSKPATTSTTPSTKKTRIRRAHAFIGQISGEEQPVIILAPTQKAALAAILTLKAASDTDLIEAGKAGHRIIDTATFAKGEAA
jgi:hypothetical protein